MGWLRDLWVGNPSGQLAPAREVNSRAVTAAATAFTIGRDQILPKYDTWQAEAWAQYEEVGEFYYGVRWLAEMISRVRLVAAKVPPVAGDEPEIIDQGPPSDLIKGWAGGIGGQSQLLRRLVVQLSVPGEGWLIGEPGTQANGGEDTWSVRSADEVKRSTRRRGARPGASGRRAGAALTGRSAGAGYGVEVVDENSPPHTEVRWRVLDDGAFVNRIWNPHDRYYTQPDSPARHARQVLKELTLANRYIQAQFLSRLASAGVFFLPSEATFPVREEYRDEPDPLAAEWIATAAEAIKHPGAASAIVPILMQLPGDVIDKVKHLDFTTAFDEQILAKREGAISRLATVMDLPKEVLLGMGDVNHWTSWQIEESGFKIHIAPVVEVIVDSFTTSWYRPMLGQADGAQPEDFLVWYDPSEIIARPDKSEGAIQLYDRGELTGEALRRETGLDESDKPEGEDLERWALIQVLLGKGGPAMVPVAYKALTGKELEVPALPAPPGGTPSPPGSQDGQPPAAQDGQRTAPDTQGEPPPAPDEDLPVAAGAKMPHPLTGWPMERRPAGWVVRNLDHDLAVPPQQTAGFDVYWRRLAHAGQLTAEPVAAAHRPDLEG